MLKCNREGGAVTAFSGNNSGWYFVAAIVAITIMPSLAFAGAQFIPVSATVITNVPQFRYIERNISASAVDVNGNIYACTNDTLLKSSDGGSTWTTLKTFTNASECRLVYVTTNGSVYVSPMNSYGPPLMDSSMPGLWRCTLASGCDEAADFTRVLILANEESIWGFDEDSNGNLYAGVYTLGTAKNAKIFKSTNNGDSFIQLYNGGTYRHVHAIEVDTLTGYIYVAFGDTNKTSVLRRSIDGGTSWDVIIEGIPQITAILATPTARLFGTDLSGIGRIYRTTDDSITNTKVVLDEWYQNCFFIRRNPTTGNLYAGFKLDPSAISPLKAAIYISKNDGITWEQVKTLENLAPGEGFWFASNFVNNKMYVGWKSNRSYQGGIVITDILLR